jgi:DNA-binding transcriptional ArsR family regulator
MPEQPNTDKQAEGLTPDQERARAAMLESLREGKWDVALKRANEGNLPDEVIHSAETVEAARQAIEYCLAWHGGSIAKDIIKTFHVPQDVVSEALEAALIDTAEDGRIDAIDRMVEDFDVPAESLKSPKVQEAAKEGIRKLIAEGWSEQNVRERYREYFGE